MLAKHAVDQQAPPGAPLLIDLGSPPAWALANRAVPICSLLFAGLLTRCCGAARSLRPAGAPAGLGPRAPRLAPARPWGSSLTQRSGSRPGSTAVAAAAGRRPDDSQWDSEEEDLEAFSWLPPEAQPVAARLSSLLKRWLPPVALLVGLVQPQLIPAVLQVLAAYIVIMRASLARTVWQLMRARNLFFAAAALRRKAFEARRAAELSGALLPQGAPGPYAQQQPARGDAAPAAAATAQGGAAGTPPVDAGAAIDQACQARGGHILEIEQQPLHVAAMSARLDTQQRLRRVDRSAGKGAMGPKVCWGGVHNLFRIAKRGTRLPCC